tara:strand:+ start:565 stop:780 length:216 start_codon:yes stop_codon:yes gene_type:complete
MIKHSNTGEKVTPLTAVKYEMAHKIGGLFYVNWEDEYPDATERELKLLEHHAEVLVDRLAKLLGDQGCWTG